MKRLYIFGSILIALLVLAVFIFYCACLNHVDVTDIGIAYNSRTGNVSVQPHPGWYATSPFVRVASMSTLPMRVTIPSKARIINSKVVRFNPAGAVEFVKLQGFTVALRSEQEDVMLGYAFSGQSFPFLDIIEEPKATVK